MDALVQKKNGGGENVSPEAPSPMDQHSEKATTIDLNRPSREEAEAAVRTLIEWAGDDPSREGLIDTPMRVVKSFEEFFAGYNQDPEEILARTFEEVEGYNDLVLVRNIEFESHCEHHMVPVIGKAHVAYLPNGKVVGLSKLARVVDVYAKRLSTQETMTAQIANAIEGALDPRGVAVLIDADHQCMSTRGVYKKCSSTITTQFRGDFETPEMERRFLDMLKGYQ